MKKTPKCFPVGLFFMFFWRNVYRSAQVPQNLLCHENFLIVCLHSGIIVFTKRSILNVWQCLNMHLSWQLLSNLYSDLILCTASDTFRILAYSELCLFRYVQAYWGIFKAYSVPCVTLAHSQSCLILSPSIFNWRHSKPCKNLTRHILNPVTVRKVYPSIIQSY